MLLRPTHLFTGVLWAGVYILLSLAPLGLVFATPSPPGRTFWTELSVALGFVGLAMMTLQFVLTARFRWLKSPYGSDVVYAFHRAVSMVAVGLVLMHPAILFVERWEQMRTRPFTHPWPFWLGTASIVALLILVIVSIFRKHLRVEYVRWRRWHALLGLAAVALATVHALLVGHYLATPAQKSLWLAYTLAWVLLILWVRLVKPWMEARTPWRVVEVRPERGQATVLRLRPVDHPGLPGGFAPGQFAWITARASPFTDREHPFSFSGSALAEGGELRFTIKRLGDFSGSVVPDLRPGETVYVDGPFGALSADRHADAPAFVFIAGGIGITPMLSHLLTFADRGETRPCTLFYGVPTLDDATHRDELDALAARLPGLRIVYVLSRPPAGWTGESGFITADVLKRHWPLPAGPGAPGRNAECFICGPQPMMDAVERALVRLGVPLGDIHAERFDLV
jgi:predicted ferric reductase